MGVYLRNGIWEFRKTIKRVPFYQQIPEAQNKLEAEVAAAVILKKIFEGKYARDGSEVGSASFEKFAKEIYLPLKKGSVSALSYRHEAYKVGALCRYFRGKCLRDLTPFSVEAFKRRFLQERCGATVRGYVQTLRQIADLAIDREELFTNPCRKVKWARGSTVSKRTRVITEEEEAKLMSELRGEPHKAAWLALRTGMRRMEILNVNAADLDAKARKLKLRRKGGKVMWLPLETEVADFLAAIKPDAAGYLFRNRTGWNLSYPHGAFKKAAERAGLKDIVFHDLRRTYATRLLRRGVNPLVIKELLGHYDLKTTEIYALTQWASMVEAVGRKSNVVPMRKEA